MRVYNATTGKFQDISEEKEDKGGVTTPTMGTKTGGSATMTPKQKLVRGWLTNKMFGGGISSADVGKYMELYPEQFPQTQEKEENPVERGDKILRKLEDMYFGNDLHYGSRAGIQQQISSFFVRGHPLSRYKTLARSQSPGLAKAAGDTGNIGYKEAQFQVKALPTARDTRESAVARFKNLRETLGLPSRDYENIGVGKKEKDTGGVVSPGLPESFEYLE